MSTFTKYIAFLCISFITLLSCINKGNRRFPVKEPKEKLCDQNAAKRLQSVVLCDTIDLDSIAWCLDKGADPNCVARLDYEYYKSLFPRGSMFDEIFGGYTTKRLDLTALQATLWQGNENFEDAMLVLLKAGADPDIITKDSMRCIDRAVQRNMDMAIIDTLLSYGADPSLINLKYAYTDFKLIDALIEKGADPFTISPNPVLDRTSIEQLPGHGWAWKQKFNKMMAYDLNPQKANPRYIEESGGWKTNTFNKYALDKLLEKGLDLNKPIECIEQRKKHQYWLQWALNTRFNDDVILYLLEKGANRCKDKVNPYELAVKNKQSDEVLEMLEHYNLNRPTPIR